jgi:ubiquitin carboxyl-terminal hydrolase 5/13
MALFQQPIRAPGSVHAEFKAGIMNWDGKTVTPDKRKGKVVLYTDDNDSLMHVRWHDREKNEIGKDKNGTPIDSIVINDAYLEKIEKCTTGRVYILRYTTHDKKIFFWMQEPKTDNDAELVKKFNDAIGATVPNKKAKSVAVEAPAAAAEPDEDDELAKAIALSMAEEAEGTNVSSAPMEVDSGAAPFRAPPGESLSSDALASIREVMGGIQVPKHYDKVFKDECVFTFDTPFSENGLCVNLKTLQGMAADMVDLDLQRSSAKGGLYLVQKFRRVAKEAPAETAPPTKLVVAADDNVEVVKDFSLLVVAASGSKTSVPLSSVLPEEVLKSCDAIIAHQGASSMDASSQWEADQELRESKYAKDLVQLPATKKISPNPKDWKCEKSGDIQNLWLNLSDGHIGGGRKFWDGSGGSNGALDHFNEEQEKGNFYPLCVKLGTITPQGADVYCYAKDEDNMVKDPYLAKHLAHWGIDVMNMEKTDKTLAEMEVDLNMNYDWGRICESGDKPLERLRGPGLVGLKNLGNSCYMNSTVQLLMALPEAKKRYNDTSLQIRRQAPSEVAADFVSQVSKLVTALNGDRYAPPLKEGDDADDTKLEIAPQMFRSLVGRGHPEFSSGRQQDACEYLQHFLELLSRAERTALGSRLEAGNSFASLFEFAVESRLQEEGGEGRVLYQRSPQNVLGLPIKLDDADNLSEVMAFKSTQGEGADKSKDTGPKAVIQLQSCLKNLVAPEGIDFRGGKASRTSRLASMPRYLLVSLQRYYLDEKWVPTKLDCLVPMPEEINLEDFRGKGIQPGEVAIPEDEASSAAAPTAAFVPDELIVAQLLSMV